MMDTSDIPFLVPGYQLATFPVDKSELADRGPQSFFQQTHMEPFQQERAQSLSPFPIEMPQHPSDGNSLNDDISYQPEYSGSSIQELLDTGSNVNNVCGNLYGGSETQNTLHGERTIRENESPPLYTDSLLQENQSIPSLEPTDSISPNQQYVNAIRYSHQFQSSSSEMNPSSQPTLVDEENSLLELPSPDKAPPKLHMDKELIKCLICKTKRELVCLQPRFDSMNLSENSGGVDTSRIMSRICQYEGLPLSSFKKTPGNYFFKREVLLQEKLFKKVQRIFGKSSNIGKHLKVERRQLLNCLSQQRCRAKLKK